MSGRLVRIATPEEMQKFSSIYPATFDETRDELKKQGLDVEVVNHFLFHDYKVWGADIDGRAPWQTATKKYGTFIFDQLPNKNGALTEDYGEALRVLKAKTEEYLRIVQDDSYLAITSPKAANRVQRAFEDLGCRVEIIAAQGAAAISR